ncbi:hypothetical protein AX16_009385 [Volvariella volvacea WC 439]|nr:hypothetical protein AX16_009385 [Volvariella volvacea WC 439]
MDTERNRIDEEIAGLEAQIVQLRRRRNALAPILRLPADILWKVMMELPDTGDLSDRVQISRVSYHLRELALQYPSLWTTISLPITTPTLVGGFITRSRLAPLEINITYPFAKRTYWDQVAPSIAQAMDRVTSLACRLLEADSSFGLKLDFSASPLEVLDVYRCGKLYGPWDAIPNLQNLTTLKLARPNPRIAPTVSEFYDTLSSLSRLRHLALEEVLSALREKTAVSSSNLVLSLMSLTSLELSEESTEECIRFVNCAGFPLLQQLNVSFKSSAGLLPLLEESLVKVWDRTSIFDTCGLPHQELKLEVTAGRAVASEDSIIELYAGDRCALSLRWKPRRVETQEDRPSSILRTLPLGECQLQSLKLAGWGFDAYVEDIEAIANLISPGPEVLILRDRPACLFSPPTASSCQHVAAAHWAPDGESQQPVPNLPCALCQDFLVYAFPNLRVVVLDLGSRQVSPGTGTLINAFLEHRKAHGRPLEKVDLQLIGSKGAISIGVEDLVN